MPATNSHDTPAVTQVNDLVTNFRVVSNCEGGAVAYRSSELHGLSAAQKAKLLELDITDVVDLRTQAESQQLPDTLPTQITLHLADVLSDATSEGATKVASLTASNTSEYTVRSFSKTEVTNLMESLGKGKSRSMMLQTYDNLVTLPSARSAYQTLLKLTLQPGRTCVFHCTAGKDRTGWGAALIDILANHNSDLIMANYLVSNSAWESTYEPILDEFSAAGGNRDCLRDLLYVSPDYLIQARESMIKNYGSVEDYILQGLKLTRLELETLKLKLE